MEQLDGSYGTVLECLKSAGLTDKADRNRQALIDALVGVLNGAREGLSSLYHPDIVFYEADCLPYGGAHRGKEAVIAAVGQLFEHFDRLETEVEEVLAAGELTIIYLHVNFRVRKNGRSGRFPACELYRFQDDKIIEWRVFYFDSNMVAEALAAD